MQNLSPQMLKDWLADPARPNPVLLDVREPWEFEICHIEGAQLMPMHSVPQQAGALQPDAEIVVICHHGVRSRHVGVFLERNGFSRIYNLSGGVDAWANQVDHAMALY